MTIASPTQLPDGSHNSLQLALDDSLPRHQLTLLRQRHRLDHSLRAAVTSLLADELVEVKRLGAANARCLLYTQQLLSKLRDNGHLKSYHILTRSAFTCAGVKHIASFITTKTIRRYVQRTRVCGVIYDAIICRMKHTLLTLPLGFGSVEQAPFVTMPLQTSNRGSRSTCSSPADNWYAKCLQTRYILGVAFDVLLSCLL